MPSTRAIVTYRPNTEEEHLIALLSQKTGLNKSRLIGLALRQMAERERVEAEGQVRLTAEEQVRLDGLNEILPRSFWKRYRTLAAKSEEETITDEEREEFLSLVQKTEAWNVRRLELLEELAQKRQMHFPELMRALGIRYHPYA